MPKDRRYVLHQTASTPTPTRSWEESPLQNQLRHAQHVVWQQTQYPLQHALRQSLAEAAAAPAAGKPYGFSYLLVP